MENKLISSALSLTLASVLMPAPLIVKAEETQPATEISEDAQEFYEQFQQEYQRIQDANQQALDEGLISAGSNDYVTTFGVYGTMRMYANYMDKMYGATDPYTYSNIPEGGSCTGLYKIAGDDTYRVVTVSTAGAMDTTLVIADDYSVNFTVSPDTGSYNFSSANTSNLFGLWISSPSSFWYILTSEFQTIQRIGEYNYNLGKYFTAARFEFNPSSVPIINPNTILTYVNPTIGGYPAYSIIPQGQIDPQRPWDYYNEELVPEIQQNFPNVTVDMLPMGTYWEPAQIDPIETIPEKPHETIPFIPFIPSVQPVTEIIENTDESGELVTEYVEVTQASGDEDIVYEYQMPTLPALKVPDIDVPLDIDIDGGLLAGVGAIWDEIYRLLVASGLMQILIPALTIGLLLYICTKLG